MKSQLSLNDFLFPSVPLPILNYKGEKLSEEKLKDYACFEGGMGGLPVSKFDEDLDLVNCIREGLDEFIGVAKGTSIRQEFHQEFQSLKDSGSEDFDFFSMLPQNIDPLERLDGERVSLESIRKKSLLVCFIPIPTLWYDKVVRALALASFKFYADDSKSNSVVEEMLVVPRVVVSRLSIPKVGYEMNLQDISGRLLEAFSRKCLSLPPSLDLYVLERALGFNGRKTLGLLIDGYGKVQLHDNLDALIRFGADFFPFETKDLNAFNQEVWKIKKYKAPLHQLLGCSCNDLVPKVSGGKTVSIPVHELQKKVVGLYLFSSGHLLPLLHKIYTQCSQVKGNEFEIVMMCVPPAGCDPKVFTDFIVDTLNCNKDLNFALCVAPFNHSASCKLLDAFEEDDGVILMGPGEDNYIFRGSSVMQTFGAQAYPFTIKSICEQQLNKINKVSLQSLLFAADLDPIEDRPALLYLDPPSWKMPRRAQELRPLLPDLYETMKIKHSNLAMVYYCLHKPKENPKLLFEDLDVTVVPYNGRRAVDLLDNLYVKGDQCGLLVAFTHEGKICSIMTEGHLASTDGATEAFIFDEDLLAEDVRWMVNRYLGI